METFSKWVKMGLMSKQELQYSKEYENVLIGMNLTDKKMMGLVSDGSTLQNMILALNGTIKTKILSSKYFDYEC